MLIACLAWIGERGPWVLVVGLVLCFASPDVSTFLRPALPWLVPLVLGLAMARVDIIDVARTALRPRTAARLLALTLAMMPVSAAVFLGVAWALGLDADMRTGLVYLAAAPPIASAANLCFLLGYDGRRALAVTVAAMVLTPVLGPLTIFAFLRDAAPLSLLDLSSRLGAMIGGGVILGLALRRGLGAGRIARQSRVFDGVAMTALVIFVLPIFDGVPELVFAEPGRALLTLAVAVAANVGVNLGLRAAVARVRSAAEAGAYGVLFGNRTIAIYLAALPYDPHFTLFVAMYQVPILLMPALQRAFLSPRPN